MRVSMIDRNTAIAVLASLVLLWCCVAQGAELALAPPEIRVPVGQTQAIEFGTPQRDDDPARDTQRVVLPVSAGRCSSGDGTQRHIIRQTALSALVNKPMESPSAGYQLGVVRDEAGGWWRAGLRAAAKQAYCVDSLPRCGHPT